MVGAIDELDYVVVVVVVVVGNIRLKFELVDQISASQMALLKSESKGENWSPQAKAVWSESYTRTHFDDKFVVVSDSMLHLRPCGSKLNAQVEPTS